MSLSCACNLCRCDGKVDDAMHLFMARKVYFFVYRLKTCNIGGDFSLYNLFLEKYTCDIITTDFVSLQPLRFSQWEEVACREEAESRIT